MSYHKHKLHFELWFFLLTFVTVRVISYLVSLSPALFTPVSLLLLVCGVFLIFAKPSLGLVLLTTELLLGGDGQLFSVLGFGLRSWFLVALITQQLATSRQIYFKELRRLPLVLRYGSLILLLSVIISAVIGFLQGHDVSLVLHDLLAFLYLLLIPTVMSELRHLTKVRMSLYTSLFIAALTANTLFLLFSYTYLVARIIPLDGSIASWYKTHLSADITNMNGSFIRILMPWQLFVPPAILLMLTRLRHKLPSHRLWLTLIAYSQLILVISLSRTYIAGVLVGAAILIILTKKATRIRIVGFTAVAATLFVTFFLILSMVSSSGRTHGLELISSKFGTLDNRQVELADYTRVAMLTPVKSAISASPFFGTGLGSEIVTIDPLTSEMRHTSQYLWGWFEVLVERGIIGMIIMLIYLVMILASMPDRISRAFPIALFSSFCVMMITVPILSTTYGICALSILISYMHAKPSVMAALRLAD